MLSSHLLVSLGEKSTINRKVLEEGDNKAQAVLYDIADDCSKVLNIIILFDISSERMKIYDEEEFDYDITKINLRNDSIILDMSKNSME